PARGGAVLVGPLALLALLVCPGSTTVVASGATAAAAAAGSDASALRLLEHATVAPARTSYRGVQFVAVWTAHGTSSVIVEVDHRAGEGTDVRGAATPGRPAFSSFLAAGDAELSLMGGRALRLLTGSYRVRLAGEERVAGHRADVVEVRRAGARLPSARFWLDRATHLVLRREDYDEAGRTSRASAFVEVSLAPVAGGDPTGPAGTAPASQRPTAWPDAIDAGRLAGMRAKGWDCPSRLPGPLHLVDARRSTTGGIVHLSYTDGLASVSVFQQWGRLDGDRLDGYRRDEVAGVPVHVLDGVPQQLVWSARGRIFTVVADAPPRTVEAVVSALPHGSADGGGLQRLGRGMDRMASWFNPFE
ncbi:MAG: sigma-E factor regulatory protein RseB domain-containing protein, partial [Actinomycetes bacterium]